MGKTNGQPNSKVSLNILHKSINISSKGKSSTSECDQWKKTKQSIYVECKIN